MTTGSRTRGSNVNLNVFVSNELDVIASQAALSSYADEKIILQTCGMVQSILKAYGDGTLGEGRETRVERENAVDAVDAVDRHDATTGLPEIVTVPLLSLLRSCIECPSKNEKIIDPALSTLHKLIAYAYLQGETRPSGRLDDTNNLVNMVVLMAAKAAATPYTNSKVQLTAVKVLLTASTAEHFVCHGDCLMLAVRTAFNIAINGKEKDVRNAGAGALLQMLNSILKRICFIGLEGYSPVRSYRDGGGGGGGGDVVAGGAEGAGGEAWDAAGGAAAAAVTAASLQTTMDSIAADASRLNLPSLKLTTQRSIDLVEHASLQSNAQAMAEQRAAQLSQLAERSDLRGLERALTMNDAHGAGGAGGSHLKPLSEDREEPLGERMLVEEGRLLDGGGGGAGGEGEGEGGGEGGGGMAGATQASGSAAMAPTAGNGTETATAATTAPATTYTTITTTTITTTTSATANDNSRTTPPPVLLHRVDTPPDPRRALMKDSLRLPELWKSLSTVEKDVVIVFSAMCKMASRETGVGAAGTYFHTGKLLALDTIVKVLTNPMHDWENVRSELAVHLRQPLCLTILRNCKSPYPEAVAASVKVLCCVMSAPSLRMNLQAELGALYPLVLLRPLEHGEDKSSAHASMQSVAALRGLEHVCEHPQVLVDVFVNYDCSLQASNLFERSVNILSKEAQLNRPERGEIARRALLKCVDSMDTWTGPLKPLLEGMDGMDSMNGVDEDADATREEATMASISQGSPHKKSSSDEMLRQLHNDKAMKSSLREGVALFNDDPMKGLRIMIDAGVIKDDPGAIAAFLVDSKNVLDPEAVGELLGHHADRSINAMQAYVRSFDFAGMTVDRALRMLLRGFRLPGEAQKIDRIMERFAEKFCEDNPGAFPVADAAYLLAFAIIMLNTDAHNPMAEGRIQVDDFVTMCMYQTEAGEYDQILPTDELVALHGRIVSEEIAVPESIRLGKSNALNGSKARNKALRTLAAATGLSRLFFEGNAWDKQRMAEQERLDMQSLSMELSRHRTTTSSHEWQTATHAEHVRPMLQVSGEAIASALDAGLKCASSIAESMPILKGYEQIIKLSALLWLENLTLALVEGLANASGFGVGGRDFHEPACAPPGSAQEAKNVAALSRLLSLGGTKEAGLLGSAWVIIFRILSGLEHLKKDLSPEEPRSPASFEMKWLPKRRTSSSDARSKANGSKPVAKKQSSTKTIMRQSQGPLTIREEPGMGLVIWAETSGANVIEKIFTNSIELDGESILTFLRALCAISQEELEPTDGSPAKLYLLQRLVECAYFNSSRIRLVWQRLWTVVSQHLVSAACCSDTYVAMFAVDALRQLADKLLCREELAGFASQGEAIRPLGSVIRCSDAVAVRELAIACVAHVVDSHADRIVGGWWAVIDALSVAASDASPEVLAHAIDVMKPVFEALYSDVEGKAHHECIEQCTLAAISAVANQSPGEDTAPATAALELFQTLCQNLHDAKDDVRLDSRKWIALLSPVAAVAKSDPRQDVSDTAANVFFFALTTYGDCFDGAMWKAVHAQLIVPTMTIVDEADEAEEGKVAADIMAQVTPAVAKVIKSSGMMHPDDTQPSPSGKMTTATTTAMTSSSRKPSSTISASNAQLRVVRQASNYLVGLWESWRSIPAARPLLISSLDILYAYSRSETDTIAESSEILSRKLLAIIPASEMPVDVFRRWLTLNQAEVPNASLQQLRRRCNSIMIGFRVVTWTLEHCQVTDAFVEAMIGVMKDSVDEIRRTNDDPAVKAHLDALIFGRSGLGGRDETNDANHANDANPSKTTKKTTKRTTLTFANAVIDMVQCTDDRQSPAFGRLEVAAETAFLESLINGAANPNVSNTIHENLYATAADRIITMVHDATASLSDIKSSKSTDSLWLEKSRVSMSAESLVYLTKIPTRFWNERKNELLGCASALVKSQDAAVRKSVSQFFKALN